MDHRSRLKELADEKMAAFNKKLIPGCGDVLGIRMPALRELAKEIAKEDWREFLADADEEYMEHLMLQGLVICYAKMDLSERLRHLNRFIPKIDNWAVCDTCQYKAKKGEREEYWGFINEYIRTPSEFGMRYGVIAILSNFIDDEHIDDVLKLMETIEHEGYYLKMGVAWNVSVCFVKFQERTMSFLNNCDLDDFTYNKSLQKILESYRVDADTKRIIRNMKRRT